MSSLSTTDSAAPFYLKFYTTDFNYSFVLSKQLEAVKSINQNDSFSLIACEHAPVFTAGRSISPELVQNIKSISDCDVVSVSRGGAFMYHGPGQLTLYFIFRLRDYFSGPRDYIESLAEVIGQYFFERYEKDLSFKNNGLWLKDKKVGFLGIRIEKGVVYHGLSLNYHTDLKPFSLQTPCDIKRGEVGNIFESPLSALFLEDESKSIGELFYEKVSRIDKASS